MRWVFLVLAATFLVGCASRWEHDSKRTSEFYADDRSCQSEAGGASRALEPGQDRVSYESCMWQKGWHKKQSIWFFDPVSQ